MHALKWRELGPFRAGRVSAVAGHPTDRLVFYFGACAGGVWKTHDGGNSWRNVSDGCIESAAVGAVAVAASDPNVVYAGMGEANIRNNVCAGDGVYRSTDGGDTWTHLGLKDTRHISRICVDPMNADVAYVGALGHAFGPNEERGVFRTRDGGKTWTKVLYRDEKSGVIDLVMDPHNPRILYAAIWEAQRTPYSLISGGPGSGIFKTIDGGDTWTELTDQPGLPEGLKGRIGLAVSAQPGRIWACVESKQGGLFRSDDGGSHWQLMNDSRDLQQRPWYFSRMMADTQNGDTVYFMSFEFWRSTDGGKTFTLVPAPHVDHHDLWIDPADPTRMINGHDGGACVSFDQGASWSSVLNQPTAQFYHVTTDSRYPYRVYGAQQDNSTIAVSSRSPHAGIGNVEWYSVGGGESGYIAVRPDNPDIVYAGANGSILTRYDHNSAQERIITPWPEEISGWGAKDLKYRFQWTYPIVISPHDPDTLYACANVVFRTRSEGASWDEISGDLTRNDKSRMEPSGGPITKDATGAETYGVVFAFAESPVQEGLLWAGSDDGLVHVSRNGGETWQNVTPSDLPEWALISIIEPSPHDAGTAYVAATRYKSEDLTPYLYKTTDYGATWQRITSGIAADDFTRVIREDPECRGLLFAGTESGVYVSFSGGDAWQSLRQNLPVVPIHDLTVKDGDLIAATHGRSFWLIDDIGPLRERAHSGEKSVELFAPRKTIRHRTSWGFAKKDGKSGYVSTDHNLLSWKRELTEDGPQLHFTNAGMNPPDGVVVTYGFKTVPDGVVTLTFKDSAGMVIKTYSSADEEAKKPSTPTTERVMASAGTHRFVWNTRYPDAEDLEGVVYRGGDVKGPLAPPGRYSVELNVGAATLSRNFEIAIDPRLDTPDSDLHDQFNFLIGIRDKITQVHGTIREARSIRAQAQAWAERSVGTAREAHIKEAAEALSKELTSIEEALVQTKARSPKDLLNFSPMLNVKLVSLMSRGGSADYAPTRQDKDLRDYLFGLADVQVKRLRDVIETKVAALNRDLQSLELPPIHVAKA